MPVANGETTWANGIREDPRLGAAGGLYKVTRLRFPRFRPLKVLLDLALPPVCFVCDLPLGGAAGLCMRCWAKLSWIEKPYCARLGTPLAYDLGEDGLSAQAIADPPPFDRARAACLHDDISRELVHGLKYRDRLELGPAMAGWMARAGADLVSQADLIVPVPLHRARLWSRRFNQAAVLAGAIAARADKQAALAALVRIRATPRQVGLARDDRQKNVRGAFAVAGEARSAIEGRRILLVDDVYTTGATVKACTRALLRARAASVDVLTFARVASSSGLPI
ncbi:ComF family protein [Breoghania corrubedonensis]|uniref:ComF family protein n=2 Tax=Breoghania corrubedonensis TaxID=665038 RepID=A0A2T5V5Y2_9HYPH|nr:ComF family protein [Breoghania corrubedonensis]